MYGSCCCKKYETNPLPPFQMKPATKINQKRNSSRKMNEQNLVLAKGKCNQCVHNFQISKFQWLLILVASGGTVSLKFPTMRQRQSAQPFHITKNYGDCLLIIYEQKMFRILNCKVGIRKRSPKVRQLYRYKLLMFLFFVVVVKFWKKIRSSWKCWALSLWFVWRNNNK